MKIYKYELPSARGNLIIRMHEIHYTMHVQVINNIPFLWACVDPDKELDYTIRAIHTGDNVPDMDNYLRVGTAVIDNGSYVLHYYREVFNHYNTNQMKGEVKRYWTTDEVNERVKQKVKEERLKVVAEILKELEGAGYGVDWNLFEIIKKLEHTK